MLVSMNWIRDFVNLDGLDIEQLIHRFTLSTAEVEDIYVKGADTKNVVVGKVLSVEAHPNSKKLHLLKVDRGDKVVDCVCGAPNVREGMKVAFACAGGSVCGNPIGTATIAGYPSEGMCCSEFELGISADHSGLMEIFEDCALGTDIKAIYEMDDIIFEVDNKSLTNRPDLWGHYGIAREFAALTGRELKKPEIVDGTPYENLPEVPVEIANKDLCYRYSSVKVENIGVRVSPVNMRIRLFYCGLRAINLLADLTNYVMLELSQPMHAFNLKKVNNVQVKNFDTPFKFKTLDGIERDIDENTLMICSNGQPVAVAGVMGGLDSEITDDTNSLLLESANFDAVSTRKSSQRLGLRTDSSMRYEKTLDPELTMLALGRLLKLLADTDPGVKVISKFTDRYVKKYPSIAITFDKHYVDRYTGIEISNNQILTTLRALGFKAEYFDNNFKVNVPSWRATKDVTIAADIIEEITRIYGYDNFNAVTTKSALHPVAKTVEKTDENNTKTLLVDKYLLHEVHSYIWCDGKKYKKLGIPVEENVRILNIPTPELGTLRNAMTPSLLCFVNENRNYTPKFGVFELGRTFDGTKENGYCNERRTLGIALYDREGTEKALFYELLAMVGDLCGELKRQKPVFANVAPKHDWQHPRNTASITLGGKQIGFVSAIHPTVNEKLDKTAAVVFAEIDMDIFSSVPAQILKYAEPSKFPGIDVDLTFVIGGGFKYAQIEQVLAKNPCATLTGVKVIDLYEGETKSITVRLSYASMEKTLSREEIDAHTQAVIADLAAKGIALKA
ncbi:MAG TPA: phenylalanine--tRNA ligase subunit beta [Oscillospiraceae bacterium]|nr:phenylalanine--tRNA ligase subunit beta [Oscillospiraceae bacterium]HPK34626.1 phenylalanine--tRNA ligase subunit beta [Oscillospiraceae bacterium]HPR74609.1 phenylalanine--tRNA ligase subunit beta [Oscillospiraceae bacterium]